MSIERREIRRTSESAQRHGQTDSLKNAEKLYESVLKDDPNNTDALHSLAIIAYQRGKQKIAADLLGRAIANNPREPNFYNSLGLVCAACGKHDEALRAFHMAVSIKSDYTDAYYNLGCALKNQGHLSEAAQSFMRALELKSDFVEAWYNLGNVQQVLTQLDAAIESYHHALEIDPDFAKAYNNLGYALKAQGNINPAITCYKEAIAHEPDFAEAHWNLALAYLISGNFTEGFKRYEWRFRKTDWKCTYPFRYNIPRWDGSTYRGKTLFVHYEQGLGDTLQFIRYLPDVKARGGSVIFETGKPLIGLLKALPCIDKIIEPSSDGTLCEECDIYIPLLSLPEIFGTQIETIPAHIPYLYADPEKVKYWQGRLSEGHFKVGIVWAGKPSHRNDHNRSCAVDHFIPLAQTPGVRLYGLQKGEAAAQAARFSQNVLYNVGEECEDFSDTAGVIENLDLIISVDTAVAHLSGAMGKRVWTLLPFAPDWRWLLIREDSPWYPTMRLFRQQIGGEWAEVFHRVAKALRVLVHTSSSP
ncbi:MAG: tetratricopeptide repeat protein [bacterium]